MTEGANDDIKQSRSPGERPKQLDRLLPLGGYQFLIMLACRQLAGRANAKAILSAIETAGIKDATEGQAAVTLKRLTDSGLIAHSRGISAVDPTRSANIYVITPKGHAILERAEINYKLVVDAAQKIRGDSNTE